MQEQKEHLSIKLPTTLKNELKAEAEAQGRSLSNYVIWLLNNRKQ